MAIIIGIMLVSFLALDSDSRILSDKDSPPYNTIDIMTRKCFFDIEINGSAKGRLVIALFGESVPITVRNFAELCSGANGRSKYSNNLLSYQGTVFH